MHPCLSLSKFQPFSHSQFLIYVTPTVKQNLEVKLSKDTYIEIMSCNGCRVLRKGCSETCMLRPCLQWIETPEAQGHATVFVAKFFGRAGLMSFISNVPEIQRPALFQSLLYEAAGRTVNPVAGAAGLLGSGNWHVCRAAVETVLRGGTLKPISEFFGVTSKPDDASECTNTFQTQDPGFGSRQKRHRTTEEPGRVMQLSDLELSLTPGFHHQGAKKSGFLGEKRRLGSPSMNSEESGTTTCSGNRQPSRKEIKLLSLF